MQEASSSSSSGRAGSSPARCRKPAPTVPQEFKLSQPCPKPLPQPEPVPPAVKPKPPPKFQPGPTKEQLAIEAARAAHRQAAAARQADPRQVGGLQWRQLLWSHVTDEQQVLGSVSSEGVASVLHCRISRPVMLACSCGQPTAEGAEACGQQGCVEPSCIADVPQQHHASSTHCTLPHVWLPFTLLFLLSSGSSRSSCACWSGPCTAMLCVLSWRRSWLLSWRHGPRRAQHPRRLQQRCACMLWV